MNQEENRYLLLGFFEFAILATLMTVFFPWSLLFCLFVFGMQETKLIIFALLHDFIKTLLAVAAVVVVIAISVVVLIALLAK